jgi:hypothetical protein
MATVNYKDVVEFFDKVSPDMAELVMGLVKDKMEAKAARSAKISANLKKARAARGSSKTTEAAAVAAAPQRRPGRPARVDDPNAALTEAATATS